MHYFITGCNGLVGSYIARKLLKEGATVSALKRKKSSLKQITDIVDQIKWYEGDILDLLSIEQAISKADFVIHCAGMVSFLANDFPLMYKINVEGTANIVNTCLKFDAKKLIYISSVAALGVNGEQEWVAEGQKWENSNMVSKYGLTKFLGEEEVWRGHSEGLDIIVVNPSVVLGRGEWGRSSLALLKYAANRPVFYPQGNINYIDARDLADIIYQLIIGKHFNERFITSAGSTSYKKMLALITAAMGKPAPKYRFNKFAAFFILHTSKIISFITNKPSILSKELVMNSMRKTLFSNKKVVGKLNFSFKKLEDTISWLIP